MSERWDKPGLYARSTKTPVERSRVDIEKTVKRYGADCFGFMSDPKQGTCIAFRYSGKYYRIEVPPADTDQRERQAWHCWV